LSDSMATEVEEVPALENGGGSTRGERMAE
jgi:hypothetical protein